MRILLVANTLPPHDLSGAGEQVLQLAWGLRQAGQEVEIVGRGGGGVRGPKVLFPLLALAPTWRRLRRWRPAVVQVHESDGGLVALLLRLRPRPRPLLIALLQVSYREERRVVRRRALGDGLVVRPTLAELVFRHLRAPLQIVLGRLSARLADLVLAPSRLTALELERDYGACDVEILPNATGAVPAADAGTNERAPLASADAYLLFVGRLRLRKGVEILLAALAELRRRGQAPRLMVVGDGERGRRLAALSRRLGLAEQVVFLGRRRPDAIAPLLRAARALVVPSLYEGMPLVVLEAMAAGVPVVASAVSGIPEVVHDGETGWLVPPGDPRALAAAIAEVWSAVDEARRRGEAGRRLLAERFRPEQVAARWLNLVAPRLAKSGSEGL